MCFVLACEQYIHPRSLPVCPPEMKAAKDNAVEGGTLMVEGLQSQRGMPGLASIQQRDPFSLPKFELQAEEPSRAAAVDSSGTRKAEPTVEAVSQARDALDGAGSQSPKADVKRPREPDEMTVQPSRPTEFKVARVEQASSSGQLDSTGDVEPTRTLKKEDVGVTDQREKIEQDRKAITELLRNAASRRVTTATTTPSVPDKGTEGKSETADEEDSDGDLPDIQMGEDSEESDEDE
eukprot:scaffold2707_cov417-Prasinococcus_capsulatus_cf.AAC.35